MFLAGGQSSTICICAATYYKLLYIAAPTHRTCCKFLKVQTADVVHLLMKAVTVKNCVVKWVQKGKKKKTSH